MWNRKILNRYLQPFLFVFIITSSLPAQADSQLNELRRIADTGAIELALKLFEQQAPDLAEDSERWATWERARLAFHAKHERWQSLIEHIDSLPPGVPDTIYFEAETYRARAFLALNKPAKARYVLRRLIWQEARTAEQVNEWRQLVIRSYLKDGSASAANISMQRYEQDYGKTGNDGLLLRARVLILAAHDKQAAELLTKSKGHAERATYLLAALRSATLSAENVIKACKNALKNKKLSNTEKLRFYSVLSEAAGVEKDSGQRIASIEDMFVLSRNPEIDDGLFRFDDDMLWRAYQQHALGIANKKQLLVGDDAAWLKEISKYKKNPLRQRSMFAWLAKNSTDENVRGQSHEGLVKSLQTRKQGLEIIRHLYSDALNDGKSNAPPIVGYVLIDQALSESDIKLASNLLGQLVAPPEGIDPLLWHLRRARVFVLAGEHDKGVKVLYRLLSSQQQFNKQQTDRFMQVLFDLQTVERHKEAFDVFSRLFDHTTDLQLRREILYWMADSRKALKDYESASQLYIRSAINPLAEGAIDLWGQSAYYQAADALAKAGYVADARNLYLRLLKISKDPGRRAVLNRQMQQLLLQQQVVGKSEDASDVSSQ